MNPFSESQKKVLAALIENDGDVSRAASYIGVSKQYIYEVIRRLREKGITFHANPIFRTLGLTPVFVQAPRSDMASLPYTKYIAVSGDVVSLNGTPLRFTIYTFPSDKLDYLYQNLPRNATTCELYDFTQPKPWMRFQEFVHRGLRGDYGEWRPEPLSKTQLDDLDLYIIRELQGNFFKHLKNIAKERGINKSTLSYHFRRHVKWLLRFRVQYVPKDLDTFPPLFAKIRLLDRNVYSLLLRVDFIQILMPSSGGDMCYAILDVPSHEVWTIVRCLSDLRDRGLLEMELLGFFETGYPRFSPLPIELYRDSRWVLEKE